MNAAAEFADEPTNPEARAALSPKVIEHAERMAVAARHYREINPASYTAEDVAGFDALVAFARGGQ